MRYLLDTNAIIRLSHRNSQLERRISREDPMEFGFSVIVRHELYFDAYKSRDVQANLDTIAQYKFEIIPFDDDDARCSGEVRAILAAAGRPIEPYDGLIAGQALARDLTLITHNTREFSRVQGLRIEDWET